MGTGVSALSEKEYCKLLIIDDEYVMRQGIKHMLEWEREGFKIIGEASDGEEGLKMAEQARPDIILADIVMPRMDGIAFTALIRQRYPKMRVIILSSYDKFEYVKQALLNGAADYILKPTLTPDNLLDVLNKTVMTIPDLELKKDKELTVPEKISRYLNGYETDLNEHMLTDYFPYTRFRFLCANLSLLCGGYKESEQEIGRILNRYFDRKKEYLAEIFRIREEYCCILLNYRVKEEDNLWGEVQGCIEAVRAYSPQTYWIYGNSFHYLNEMKERHEKATVFTGYRFYYKGKPLCRENTLKKQSAGEKFDYEKYASCLKYRSFEEALQMLGDHVKKLCNCETEEYLLKNTTKNLLYNFLIEWEKEEQGKGSRKTDYFREIDGSIYLEDFQSVMKGIMADLHMKSRELGSGERNIAQMCTYIREHYRENLELLQLAEQFNYNYNYLSTYFNQQVEEGFSGYVNRIRIEKACELLTTTQHSIAQVSDLVGYSDHSYFCRVFKNIKGRTPSQWRKTIIKQ